MFKELISKTSTEELKEDLCHLQKKITYNEEEVETKDEKLIKELKDKEILIFNELESRLGKAWRKM